MVRQLRNDFKHTGLLIVLNGIEIYYINFNIVVFQTFNRTKWN